MPRANRHFLPGYTWHITHRCHKQEFFFKFKKYRERWIYWLFESKKRYGLSVMNFMVTCNHIHLLVEGGYDETVIPRSMQLIAGKTAQEFNLKRQRKGAFWEDRYHATAIDRDDYFLNCMLYIDMNMVRAGVVRHPCEWKDCGYQELFMPKERYSIIDRKCLLKNLGLSSQEDFLEKYPIWLDDVLAKDRCRYEEQWSNSIAVGSKGFVEKVKFDLGSSGEPKKLEENSFGEYSLKEESAFYGLNEE